jgi:predicted N-acyltransferase
MTIRAKVLKATIRVWKDFSASYDTIFRKMMQDKGYFHIISYPGTSVSLPGSDKKDYIMSIKSSRRNKILKKLRQANEVALKVEIVSSPDQLTLDAIFQLFWKTYEKGHTKFERLNRDFFEQISRFNHVHYVILRTQDTSEMVAFALCFLSQDHVINKFIGIDYERPKDWFLYFRLWDAVVEWAYSKKAKSIQSGQTSYSAKIELGNDIIPLSNFCRHFNPLINWTYKQATRFVNWDALDEDLSKFLKAYPNKKPPHFY